MIEERRATSWTSEDSCWDSRMKASESGGARMLMRDRVEEMLRRTEWSNGRGWSAVGDGVRGSEGSER